MIKLIYLDEEQGWQSTFHDEFNEKFELIIPEKMPRNINELWPFISDAQVVITDYRLNGSGDVAYTGDDVARMIHKHNKHLPVFIITSYEDNAIQECTEVQIIRGKEMFTEPELQNKLTLMISAAVNVYESKKKAAEDCIQSLQEIISSGGTLSSNDESNRFDAELYLSELNMDSSSRANMITSASAATIDNMLAMAKSIIINHEGQ